MAEVYQPSPPSSAGAMQIAMSAGRTPTSTSSRRSTTPGSFYEADTPEFERRAGDSGSSTGVKRWKRLHEQQTMEQLSSLRQEKKESILIAKQKARETARKISVELLAREWLAENQATVEIRAYLVDKLLPTLILGVEKLLTVVDFQELAETDKNANFNPLNFLAQYLLRNNPKYSNFAEASPYVRGIRQVSEDLRMQLFNMEDNRLAKIKADVKRRRTEREHQQHLKLLENIRRSNCLLTQFTEWNVAVDGRVELSLFQNALRSFNEVAENFPEELKRVSRLGHSLEPTDETGITLTLNEFVKYISSYIENLPREVFEQFMVHMSKCAAAYRASAEREQRRIYLSNLFMKCDHSGIALLDRHRILNLFEQYWDQMKNDEKCKGLRNPRQWPVVEVDEADDSVSDEEEEEDEPSTQQTTEEVALSQQEQPSPQTSEESTQKTLDENKDLKEEEQTETKEEEIKDEQKVEVEDNKTEENQTQEPKVVETAETPQDSADAQQEIKQEEQEVKDGETQDGEGKEAEGKEEEVKDAEVKDGEAQDGEVKDAEVKEEEVKEVAPEQKETADSEKEKGEAEETVKETNETNKVTDAAGSGTDTVKPVKPVKPKSALKAEREEAAGQTGRISVTFAEGTAFEREKTGITLTSRSQSQMSAFDESSLNVSQFVQLTETFLGDEPVKDVFTRLLKFIKDGYEETEEEKMERLTKARREAVSAKRKSMIDVLFEKWDNDGSGYLDLEDVEDVMVKYKDGQEVEAIYYAKEEMKKKSRFQDQRLSKREFRMLIQLVVQEIPGSETFDSLLEFLTNSVERSYSDRIRGEARKKWLQQIVTAAETGGASMEPVYRAVFQALYKDAEAHGGGKKISANISMSERNVKFPQRGETVLRYVAATPEDADYVLDKILYKDMKGVSFAALESGKPIHVPRVGNHGNIHFWNTRRRPEEREGSFIVIPLKDKRKRAFGLLGIDTIADPHTKAIFITHEIQFFQGIAKAFSIAYHHVDMRRYR
ncbi:EF-hand calcium-binding domain-containing protein 5 [Patella vulgata]|uniref:EF-hand calcium-binding domain-containing protein 5 n=1 Tax=Patella vulgata TaxID=6465 RepID=UPI00218096B9|nr:EF-hand calcium-binding domain-containing protein 5 [Patella vulgata]